jgi:DNA-binding protein H-NS
VALLLINIERDNMTLPAIERVRRALEMSSKKVELESMSVNDLWSLHEKVSAILSARIKAEKLELEKRLAVLDRGAGAIVQSGEVSMMETKRRRKYPRVLPKYRNPQTSETWSGRGKLPRWLVAAMKSGRKIEDFRIGEGNGARGRQRA